MPHVRRTSDSWSLLRQTDVDFSLVFSGFAHSSNGQAAAIAHAAAPVPTAGHVLNRPGYEKTCTFRASGYWRRPSCPTLRLPTGFGADHNQPFTEQETMAKTAKKAAPKKAVKKVATKAAAKPAAPKPIKEVLTKSGLVAHR